MWAYSWPFSTFGFFTWMQQVSDRWALEGFASSADVGQYAILFQLGYSPIIMVTGMATTFLGPILFQRSGDATNIVRNTGVHHLTWKLTYLTLFFTGVAAFFTFLAHEWLFSILVAREYRSLSLLLPWIVLAGGLFAAGQTLSLKLMSEMRTGSIAIAKIVTALLGVGLNILGAMLAGLNGVIFALVAFSVSYLLWMSVLTYENMRVRDDHPLTT
jgi:O-antigen/teichoic acid export membrane protein